MKNLSPIHPQPRRLPVLVFWGIVFGIWTVISLLVTTQMHYRFRWSDNAVPWIDLALFQTAYWYGWALITPFVFFMGRTFPAHRSRWVIRLVVYVIVGIVVSVLMLAWFSLLIVLLGGQEQHQGESFPRIFVRYLLAGFHYDVLTYGAVLGTGLALNYYTLFRQGQFRATQLETALVKAQLDLLQMQLHPHFLFNTLNAISALVEEDPPGARRMIARLSHLLRISLDRGNQPLVKLRDELEILDCYLGIETCRFHDRLDVHRRIESECLELYVPSLILQPLVENALRHGLRDPEDRCRLEVNAGKTGDRLVLFVQDNGPGIPTEDLSRVDEGIGLTNLRTRLRQIYADQGRLFLERPDEGGLRVVIHIPLQSQASFAFQEGPA